MDGARDGECDPRQGATRLAIALLALTTLVVNDGLISRPAEAADLGGSIAAVRRSQAQAQRAMRKADRRIAALKRARAERGQRVKAADRRLQRLKGRRTDLRKRTASASRRLRLTRNDLARELAVRPHPLGLQVGSRPATSREVKGLRGKVRQLERAKRKVDRKTRHALKEKRKRTRFVARFKRRIDRSIGRRETAASRLGAAIRRMSSLAQQKATSHTRVGPARSGFRKPARGRITQRYGCTVSRRGSCRRFHDGIDIAGRPGSPVRASATGVVAYVGWNPWDRGRRAYMVIIGHRGGFESLYAHLRPVRRVRVGQLVRKGQTIGLMGSTGRSSGPHVHWEVRRGSSTIDPLRFR